MTDFKFSVNYDDIQMLSHLFGGIFEMIEHCIPDEITHVRLNNAIKLLKHFLYAYDLNVFDGNKDIVNWINSPILDDLLAHKHWNVLMRCYYKGHINLIDYKPSILNESGTYYYVTPDDMIIEKYDHETFGKYALINSILGGHLDLVKKMIKHFDEIKDKFYVIGSSRIEIIEYLFENYKFPEWSKIIACIAGDRIDLFTKLPDEKFTDEIFAHSVCCNNLKIAEYLLDKIPKETKQDMPISINLGTLKWMLNNGFNFYDDNKLPIRFYDVVNAKPEVLSYCLDKKLLNFDKLIVKTPIYEFTEQSIEWYVKNIPGWNKILYEKSVQHNKVKIARKIASLVDVTQWTHLEINTETGLDMIEFLLDVYDYKTASMIYDYASKHNRIDIGELIATKYNLSLFKTYNSYHEDFYLWYIKKVKSILDYFDLLDISDKGWIKTLEYIGLSGEQISFLIEFTTNEKTTRWLKTL